MKLLRKHRTNGADGTDGPERVRVIGFGKAPTVVQDRYRKQIKEREHERAESNYARTALVGAGLGMLLRGKARLSHAAMAGAGAGLAAQGVTRIATHHTKDQFGERS